MCAPGTSSGYSIWTLLRFPGHTRDYLAAAEKAGRVVTVTGELPKSFIVTTGESPAVYISQISAGTLKKRSGYVDGISNIEK